MLFTVMLPVPVPVLAGVKVTFRAAISPGFRIVPLGIPPAVKPGPETVILVIVTAEFVAFVKVTVTVLLSPRATLPRLRLEVLGPNCPALTVALLDDASVVVPEQPVWQIAPIAAAINKISLTSFPLAQNGVVLGEPFRFMSSA